MPNTIKSYDRAWETFKSAGHNETADEIQHLVWAVLDYWLFFQDGTVDFGERLWDTVTDREGNGAFYEIMTYTPVRENEEAV
jgi:hypothetical protein